MRFSSLLLPALSLLALSAPSLTAQTLSVYDDFTGTAIDTSKWLTFSPHTSVANSRLRFNMTAVNMEELEGGVITFEGLSGDFDIVLDFDNFSNTIATGGALELFVEGATNPIASDQYVGVEIVSYKDSTNKIIRRFGSFMDNGTNEFEAKGPTITDTAGQLRITRTATGVAVLARTSQQKGWTLIKTWPPFLPKLVRMGINAFAGDSSTNNSGKLAVDCDKISLAAKRIAGPVNYGKNCDGILTIAAGFPYVGNASFGYLFGGNSKLGGSATVMILGSNKLGLPIKIGSFTAPNCFLNTNPILILMGTILDSNGEGSVGLPVPNDQSLIGVNVKVQHMIVRIAPSPRIAFTQGVETKIFKL
jgi:hypothetical protein